MARLALQIRAGHNLSSRTLPELESSAPCSEVCTTKSHRAMSNRASSTTEQPEPFGSDRRRSENHEGPQVPAHWLGALASDRRDTSWRLESSGHTTEGPAAWRSLDRTLADVCRAQSQPECAAFERSCGADSIPREPQSGLIGGPAHPI